ncbi:serine/threonine-protein kinase [Polyangium aurulentum]|uniref:serine/threonine-protein kinase n=1 Tax=Polyangium aurulentum TaxID=2567896 RepID=UPI0010AE29BF|nr:serine/threonine-protein kinase [Polyangium aurulentum]UQA58081.1 protein kinase [Polyangium aurulentum]
MRKGDLIAGRFELEHLAGHGGMGVVYRARDRHGLTPVAVKLLSDPNPHTAARFDHEARILSELRHPNIVEYVAHGLTHAGVPYIVMEWLEGESLAARLARAPVDLDGTLALAARVAEALGAAHARGIIHRDVKPSNLFLDGGDIAKVKVLDFGIAQMYGATRRLTATGSIIGTPGYMAPEQASGDGRRVDARADVFSLGAVIFECLTGRPVFEGAHVMAILAKLLLQPAPQLSELMPELPGALTELVMRMLAKEPDLRPIDGVAVAEALQSIPAERKSFVSLRPPSSNEVLTGSEQRLMFVVAAAPPLPAPAAVGPQDATVAAPGLPPALVAAAHAAVEPDGASVHELASGALLATLLCRGHPTDLAARAARIALRLRALLPEGPIALVTGRDEARGKLPLGPMFDRAAKLLDTPAEPPPSEVEANSAPRRGPGVLIDDVTRALLDVRFDVTNGGTVLRGEREVGKQARTLLGKPSPYVGRERELRTVRDLVDQSFGEGMARAILVLGNSGMGKSRLRYEILARVREDYPGVRVALGRGDSISAGSAFAILGSALRGAAQITAGEPLEVRREKLDSLAGRWLHGADRQRVVEFLGEIVGTPFPDEGRTQLRAARQNAALMADQIREAFLDYIAGLTRVEPLLFVLEDLHWGDAASINLLDAALCAHKDRPFVVLALARPETLSPQRRPWAERDVHEIWLRELPRRAAESLVRFGLGAGASEAVVNRLVDRAAGNAFYLEELIRAVAEGRGNALPETVLGMVEARLLALDPEARRLLRAASVFGEAFWEDGVRVMCGAEDIRDLLGELEARELVTRRKESRFSGQNEYAFRHALLREGSYAMLTERDQALAHRLAAEWLLAAGEQDPKVLAEHCHRAGEHGRAISHYVRAAEQALSSGDLEAAIALSDRGRGLGAAGEEAASLWAIETEARTWSRHHMRAYQAALEALKVASPGSRSHCRALGGAVSCALSLRNPEAVSDLLGRLLRAEPAPDAVLALCWAFSAAITSLLHRAPETAGVHMQRMEQITEGAMERDPAIAAWTLHVRAHWARSAEQDPWRALALDRASVERFAMVGDRCYLPHAHVHAGFDYALLGAYERAEAEIRAGLVSAQEGSLPSMMGNYFQAFLLLERGALDGALDTARFVVDAADQRAERVTSLQARLLVAEVLLRRREFDEAEREISSLGAEVQRLPASHAWYLTTCASLRLAEGKTGEALSLANRALDASAALGARHLASHGALLLVRAEALLAAGQKPEARSALAAARDDLMARAGRIGDLDLQESFLERRPLHARTLTLCKKWLGD